MEVIMTELKCTAKHCIHNADNYCCKGEIQVEGRNAEERNDTCCGSFDERRNGAFCNMEDTPSSNLEVRCDATNCVYNQDLVCHANRIDIHGPSAHTTEKTECATFQKR